MITCKQCGKQISDEANFCLYCGCPCQNNDFDNALYSLQSKRKNHKTDNKAKKSVVVVMCFVIVMITVWCVSLVLSDSSTNTNSESEASAQDISELLVLSGYNNKQAEKIEKVLFDLGINSIEIVFMSGDPQNGLNAVNCYPNGSDDDVHRFNFTTEDGDLLYVGFLDEDLYDSENGGIIKRYDEVHIPEDEVSYEAELSLMMAAEDVITKYLNYPATADFHTMSWRFARSDDKYSASGTVSAQNAFGVEDEMPFSVYFELVNGKLKIEKVSLDGTIVYEK